MEVDGLVGVERVPVFDLTAEKGSDWIGAPVRPGKVYTIHRYW